MRTNVEIVLINRFVQFVQSFPQIKNCWENAFLKCYNIYDACGSFKNKQF